MSNKAKSVSKFDVYDKFDIDVLASLGVMDKAKECGLIVGSNISSRAFARLVEEKYFEWQETGRIKEQLQNVRELYKREEEAKWEFAKQLYNNIYIIK